MSTIEDGPKSMTRSLETIVLYEALLIHEETLVKVPHSVMNWYLYLVDIDNILEEIYDAAKRKFKPMSVGGKFFVSVDQLPGAVKDLHRVRIDVAERGLALLPGSYKLWKSHLEFRLSLIPSSYAILGRTTRGLNVTNNFAISAAKFRSIQSTFERAMVRMNKMPTIWRLYLDFVTKTHSVPTVQTVTSIRQLFDRALLALPVTQHDKVWDKYLKWIQQSTPMVATTIKEMVTSRSSNLHELDAPQLVPQSPSYIVPMQIPAETTLRVMRRYAHHYNPCAREELALVCLSLKRYGECVVVLMELLNDVEFVSPLGTTRHDLWMVFADTCTKHPEQTQNAGIDFDKIVRAAIKRGNKTITVPCDALDYLIQPNTKHTKPLDLQFALSSTTMDFGEIEGTLWCKLADYYTRLGEFEASRSIYEEAMEAVTRVRDFSLVFDAYSKFEEATIAAHMTLMENDQEVSQEDDKVDGDEDAQDLKLLLDTKGDTTSTQDAIELEMARAEYLLERRPLLLNRVLLKQNPHNVGEWLHRAEIYQKLQRSNSHQEAVVALEDGCLSVNANHAVNGNPSSLWISLAKLHEDVGDKESVRQVFRRVCIDRCYKFKATDDWAQVWTAWVEYELRIEDYDEALSVIRQAVAPPTNYPSRRAQPQKRRGEAPKQTQAGLHRSLRLWNLFLDLEESLGGLANAKAAYERCIELGVATPQIILNYATFLSDHKYYEECFTAYEKGVDLFPFPHPGASHIWSAYLKAFNKRYGGTKIERSRELFERCIENVPPDKATEFYLLYAQLEEQHGLAKRALSIYERLCTAVPVTEKLKAYKLYIAKAEASSGAIKTRPIFEAAIAALEDRDAAKICLQYADLETRLGELDRARAALNYGAQVSDPRRDPDYWKQWHAFEVAHGDEETFREMLRVKRMVSSKFSTVNYNALEIGGGPTEKFLSEEEAMRMIEEREGVKQQNTPNVTGFVSSGKRSAAEADLDDLERRAARLRQATSVGLSSGGPGEGRAEQSDMDNVEDDEK